ncbi:MAG TPA: hypothetical protein ENL15_00245, partial [Firmicutes bacterium]|nr:hypothetical protein [Bacillota bacterium]
MCPGCHERSLLSGNGLCGAEGLEPVYLYGGKRLMVKRSCIILWALTILFLCRAFGFPLPYELTVRSEGDLIRYYEEGYFEGIALEELLSLYRDKVNLNTATLSELESIFYISKKEAGRIREFGRKQVLFSLNQLLTEKLVSSRTFQLIHPFVRTGWIHKVNGDMRTEADQKGVSSRVSLSVGPLEGDMRVDYRDRAEFIPGEEYRLKRVDAVVIPEDWFVSWKRGRFFLITGSFKAHFAQGLAV